MNVLTCRRLTIESRHLFNFQSSSYSGYSVLQDFCFVSEISGGWIAKMGKIHRKPGQVAKKSKLKSNFLRQKALGNTEVGFGESVA